jgi:regulator of ribonuclease activity A
MHEDKLVYGTLRVLAPVFRSFGKRAAFAGPAATLKVFEDNGLVRAALEEQGAGRVLVIDGGGSLRRALVGDQLAELAVKNGWAGVLVYGCIRDSRAIGGMDIGVFAIDTHPMKTVKLNVGEAEIPVSFGGVSFVPGEWLYADEDGVIVSSSPLHDTSHL